MELLLSSIYRSFMIDLDVSETDRKYLLKRLAAEGIKFLTIELPKISKAVIHGLEIGRFDRSSLTSFRFQGSTIAFCGSIINLIFDPTAEHGTLLSNPSGAAIGTIRQLCEYVYKLALPFDLRTEEDAKEAFRKNEKELSELGRDPKVIGFANQLRKDFETYWPEISRTEVHKVFEKFKPRSTSGTYINSDDKYFLRKQSIQERNYPRDCRAMSGHYKPYPGLTNDSSYRLKPVLEPVYSELLLVPKDSRGPRTICRETLHRVETQMAYFDFMTENLHHGSDGAINFLSQQVNRLIAEESSVTKEYATLDLKDASDRVSQKVISIIFQNSPACRWFTSGSRRATHVNVDGDISRMFKLAGMGSGLTFPTMSLLISLAICRKVYNANKNMEYSDIRKDVFVYGDDICLPTKWVKHAVAALAAIGLCVNASKSFVNGSFRESCGADFFNGIDVTPCRLKLTNSKAVTSTLGRITLANNANAFKQVYEHSKELYGRGLISTAKYFLSVLNNWYTDKFGVPMVPGVYDVQCSLPLLFTKGTKHMDATSTSVVYAIQPERIGRLSNTAYISNKGQVCNRDPYVYLGSHLRETACAQPIASYEATRQMNIDRMDPGISSRFDELTVPRKLTFCKKEVPNTFIIESPTLEREDYLNAIKNKRFWEDIAVLIYSSIFLQAFI